MVHSRHVLFYRREDEGILVSRILQQRMLPVTSDFDDKSPSAQ
jgi:plasmid stabilization system protein ParE